MKKEVREYMSSLGKKRAKQIKPQERSDWAKKYWDQFTPEERTKMMKKRANKKSCRKRKEK